MGIVVDLKAEWRKNKIRTGFYISALVIAILSFLKPAYTESIWTYFGISAINLAIISAIIFIVWWYKFR